MLFTITKCYGGFSDCMYSSLDFDWIYLDFAKAVDRVSHTKLIFKLSQIRINGCIFSLRFS